MRDSRVSGRCLAIIAQPPRQRHDSPLNAQLDEIGRRTRAELGLHVYITDPAVRGRLTEMFNSWLDARGTGTVPAKEEN
jgi:hypothetical protein